MLSKLLLSASLLATTIVAQYYPNPNYTVTPLIGTGSRGDGGPAVQAILDGPYGLAQDSQGNIYVAEANAGVIRRIRPNGTIEHFTGSLDDPISPTKLLVAPDGGLLYYDSLNCRLRKVSTDGSTKDIAGTGRCIANGLGGTRDRPALETLIASLGGMVFDKSGHLVYTDSSRNVVRRLDDDGFIRVIAGTGTAGYYGDDYPADTAVLDSPAGLALDANGTLYIADGSNCRVRSIDSDGNIHTVVGTTFCARVNATYTGGSNAALERVDALVYDPATNSLLISLPRVYRIVRFDLTSLRLSPFMGTGAAGTTAAPEPLKMPINSTGAVLPSPYGTLVSDTTAYQVYAVQSGVVRTYAGHWPQVPSFPSATEAQVLSAKGSLPMADGSLLVADSGSNRVVKWQSPNSLTPVAGIINPGGNIKNDNGPAISASVTAPTRFLVRPTNGDILVAEPTRVRAIDVSGNIRTLRSNIDGLGGMVLDSAGRLIYSESNQHRVMRLDFSTGKVTILAGVTGKAGFYGDGAAATSAYLYNPGDLAWATDGSLLIADRGNHRIRVYTFDDGYIKTLYGSGLPFPYNNITGQKASDTGFGDMAGMITDAAGNIYVADGMRVVKIDTNGVLSIVTGMISQNDDGSNNWMDGPMTDAAAVSRDDKGNLYISLGDDGRVILATPIQR